MRAYVNELLTYARPAFHFYTELKGGRPLWDNPGHSLISLCAFSLNQNFIQLNEASAEALRECEEFMNSPSTLSELLVFMNVWYAKCETACPQALKKRLNKAKQDLAAAAAVAESFIAVTTTGSLEDFDDESMLPDLYQKFFDLKLAFEDIEALLPDETTAA